MKFLQSLGLDKMNLSDSFSKSIKALSFISTNPCHIAIRDFTKDNIFSRKSVSDFFNLLILNFSFISVILKDLTSYLIHYFQDIGITKLLSKLIDIMTALTSKITCSPRKSHKACSPCNLHRDKNEDEDEDEDKYQYKDKEDARSYLCTDFQRAKEVKATVALSGAVDSTTLGIQSKCYSFYATDKKILSGKNTISKLTLFFTTDLIVSQDILQSQENLF